MGVYSVQDYVVYIAILFVVVSVFLKVFERLRPDKKFLKAIAPYIFVGVFIRLLADAKAVEFSQWWSVTPGVYIVTVLLASFFIAVGFLVKKITGGKIDYWPIPFAAGLLLSLFLLYMMFPYLENPGRMACPVIMAFSLAGALYALSILLKIEIFQKKGNLSVVFAHMLDASSTYIAYNYYDFSEEHLLPIYFISLAQDNAFVMVPIKLLIICLTLYFIEKWYREEEKTENARTLYTVLKLLIFIIGIGPGLRNTMLPALKL